MKKKALPRDAVQVGRLIWHAKPDGSWACGPLRCFRRRWRVVFPSGPRVEWRWFMSLGGKPVGRHYGYGRYRDAMRALICTAAYRDLMHLEYVI